jgi:uncharacterized protein
MSYRLGKISAPKKAVIRRSLKFSWALALVIIVISAVTYGGYIYKHQHIEAGQFHVSDIYPGESLSSSLDLKLALKGTYPSKPITVIKDLGAANGIQTDQFSFKVSNDSLIEYGLLTLPAGSQPASGFPTLILLHGFSSPRDYLTDSFYIGDMQFYSQHGFAVFKPDFRGQGLSRDSAHPDSAYYSMAYNTDVMSLISALKQTSLVNTSKISLWGHSMGAYVALRAAVLSKDIKDVILLSGPVDSLKKMYLTYVPPSDARDPYALATRNTVFSRYHTPASNSEFWKDASPINFVSQIKAHVQIHVGLEDATVPPEFSADLDTAFNQHQIKHDYFTYPDGPHSLLPQRDLIWSRSLELLDSND